MFEGLIYSKTSEIGHGVAIGQGSKIIGQNIIIEDGVKIGAHVEIICDNLKIGKDSKIGAHVKLKCPEIILADSCVLSGQLEVEFNEYFHLGRCSVIGKHVAMAGQGFKCGNFLWMKDHVIVGGGGAKGPRSYLTIGDQTSVFDRCYINLSEPVEIGSESALSFNVSLLTHAAWQPALMGFGTRFSGIKIGDNSVIYLNSSIMPGIDIGSFTTVGAHSLVTKNIPDHCLAAGVPANILKEPTGYPKSLSLEEKIKFIEGVLRDYLTTLEIKEVKIVSESLCDKGEVVLLFAKEEIQLFFLKEKLHLSLGDCLFDLNELKMSGEASPLSEDLRDYLRRRAVKIHTGKSFKVLPLTNLSRLNALKQKFLA